MSELRREKVWDPVIRAWHWILAIVVVTGWSLGEFMKFSTIQWHFYCGYTVLALLALRFVWGFAGPAPVRFRALVPRPREIMHHVKDFGRREPSGSRGHNALGALSVIAILAILLTQATTGLFIESDDYFESGPLAYLVADDVRDALNWWHKLFAKVILALVCLHVAAIFYHLLWKRENLIGPMVTGWKWVKADSAPADE